MSAPDEPLMLVRSLRCPDCDPEPRPSSSLLFRGGSNMLPASVIAGGVECTRCGGNVLIDAVPSWQLPEPPQCPVCPETVGLFRAIAHDSIVLTHLGDNLDLYDIPRDEKAAAIVSWLERVHLMREEAVAGNPSRYGIEE